MSTYRDLIGVLLLRIQDENLLRELYSIAKNLVEQPCRKEREAS